MRTSSPLSTISYNTEPFLRGKLEEWKKAGILEGYIYILHKPEEDEKKEHIHLLIIPNKLIDSVEIQRELIELDPKHPDKPLKCLMFRKSGNKTDFEGLYNWILYNEHDRAFLASKFESRKVYYTFDDFKCDDKDNFEQFYHEAHYCSEWAQRNQILQRLSDSSVRPADLILSGTLPLQMASQINALSYLKQHYGTDRGTHKNHEFFNDQGDLIDPETGELVFSVSVDEKDLTWKGKQNLSTKS